MRSRSWAPHNNKETRQEHIVKQNIALDQGKNIKNCYKALPTTKKAHYLTK